jgi:CheY-like chemotaxis protein
MDDIDLTTISALVVEDDPGGIAIISAFLRRSGVRTVVDSSGMQVVENLHDMRPPPNIIFLDLKMPHKTGFEILEEIRAHEQYRDIPVVAVTALDAHIAMPQCQKAGFNGYIAKPLRRALFMDQIQRILKGFEVWDAL